MSWNVSPFHSTALCEQKCLKTAILWLEMKIRDLTVFRFLGVAIVFWVQFSLLVALGQVGNVKLPIGRKALHISDWISPV